MGSRLINLYLSIFYSNTYFKLRGDGLGRSHPHKLTSSGERDQKGRSSGDSRHGQAGTLHGFFNGGPVWSNPSVFGIVLRRGIEHWETFWRFSGLSNRHLEHFGEMQCVAVRLLGNLLAATETVGNDEPVSRSLANGGQQFKFADGFRNFVFVFFKAERSGHAAASRRRRCE